MMRRFSSITRRCAPAAALALAHCAVGPDFHVPKAPDGAGYAPRALPIGQGNGVQAFSEGYDLPGDWWTLFHNTALNDLVTQALAHNPSLKSAQEALRVAYEQQRAQAGAFFPQVNSFFNPTRNKTSIALSPVPGSNNYLYNLHTSQLNITYTLDLWGSIRRQHESLKAQQAVQRYQLEGAYLTLTSSLVGEVFQYATVRAQIAATEEIIATQQGVLTSSQAQHGLGAAAIADIAAQEALLGQAQAALPALRQQLEQAHDQIAVLAGLMPNAPLPDFTLNDFTLPQTLPATLPSRLIEQRPDVKAAQEVMHDASAQLGVAIANRLPNVQLQAFPSIVVNAMSQFFTPGYGMWTIGTMISQPLFQGGALLHLERAARHNLEQTAQDYQTTVLAAVQDTADSLHAVDEDTHAVAADEVTAKATAQSLRITQGQLRLGDVSQVMLLNAQQADAQARLTLIAARGARLSDTVGLFQSIGGGWWHRQDAPKLP